MRINMNNAAAVQSAIDSAQNRCTARAVTPHDVERAARTIEKNLNKILPKKFWRGLKFCCDPNAQNFPKAYKYAPESTRFTLERGSAGWFVVSVSRGQCARAGHAITPLNLKTKSAEILEHIAMSGF